MRPPPVAPPWAAPAAQGAVPPASTYSRRSVGKAASFIPDGAAAPSSSFHYLLHTDGTTIHEFSKLYGWGGRINLVWQYLDQHLSGYFIRAAHILITIDIEPTTELACHPIFADKCLASDLHNSTKWEQRGTGYRIAPPTNVHS